MEDKDTYQSAHCRRDSLCVLHPPPQSFRSILFPCPVCPTRIRGMRRPRGKFIADPTSSRIATTVRCRSAGRLDAAQPPPSSWSCPPGSLLLVLVLFLLLTHRRSRSRSLTYPRSCRRPRRRAGAGGRGSPPTCPSSRGRWPRGTSSPCRGTRWGWSRAGASASPRRR